MPKFELPIAQGFYVSESLPISSQECINLYPSVPETSTITKGNLFGTPGLEEVADVGAGNTNRGGIVFNGVPYLVNGDRLYRLNYSIDVLGAETWTAVDLGEIPGSERVSIDQNGVEICIVVPELDIKFNTYLLDAFDVLTQVSDVDFNGPASSVVFNDSYFVFTKKDENQFFISASRDGSSYNALDFGSAESDPDPIVADATYRNQLIIFGSETFQGFQNVGGADFPYAFAGVVEKKGCFSPSTLIESEGLLFWVGGTSREKAQILMYDGGRPQAISTRAIESVISKYNRTELAQAYSYDYAEDGADFIVFSFPEETFVYDLSTGLWHTRQSTNEIGQASAHRVSIVLEAYGFLIAGDNLSGLIGRMSRDTLDEYGVDIQRTVVFPPFDNQGNPVIVNGFELVCETGETTGGLVRLSWSDDGGRSYSDEWVEDLGDIGEYQKRVYWNGLGFFDRSRIFKLETSSRVKIAFIKAEVNIDA